MKCDKNSDGEEKGIFHGTDWWHFFTMIGIFIYFVYKLFKDVLDGKYS